MEHSNALQDLRELRQLEKTIAEKTGYKTKVYFVKDDEGHKQYQVHVSANDKVWKYVNVPFEDVSTSYNDFMFSLLQCPSSFNSYDMGKYGLLLEDALNAHGMDDIGYTLSYGKLISHDMIDMVGNDTAVETLCKCADITRISVVADSDDGLNKIIITAKGEKIAIDFEGHTID